MPVHAAARRYSWISPPSRSRVGAENPDSRHPQAARRAIATALVEAAEAWRRERGARGQACGGGDGCGRWPGGGADGFRRLRYQRAFVPDGKSSTFPTSSYPFRS